MLASRSRAVDLMEAISRIDSVCPLDLLAQPRAVASTQTLLEVVQARDFPVVATDNLLPNQLKAAMIQLGWCRAALSQSLTGEQICSNKKMCK